MTIFEAYIGLGANIGNCEDTVRRAIEDIAKLPQTALTRQSSLYRTPPWGKTDQPSFVNAVVQIHTSLTPPVLLTCCQNIEKELGRVRYEHWGPRIIDIDLLHVDGVRLQTATLTLPHPYLTRRAFVLVPLCEIAPELTIRGLTVSQWLELLGGATHYIERMSREVDA